MCFDFGDQGKNLSGICSLMMYESEICPVRVEDLRCMEINCMRMIQWMCKVSLKNMLRSDDLRGGLNLDSIRRCVQNRRL